MNFLRFFQIIYTYLEAGVEGIGTGLTMLARGFKSIFSPRGQSPFAQFFRVKSSSSSSPSSSKSNFIQKNLSKEISFITNAPGVTKLESKHDNPLALNYNSNGRPLSVLLFWLNAVDKTMNKYINLYLDEGFDILIVRISPRQLIFPLSIFHLSDRDLPGFLEATDHKIKFVHGFSVGGYVFTRMMIHCHRSGERGEKLLDSFSGHIWESIVDVQGGPYGISKTVFPNSDILQKTLQKMIELHFIIMRPWATKYYDEAHEGFYHQHLKCPGLFIGSERDPISTTELIQGMREAWTRRGVESQVKIWPDTKHVGSYQKHPEEYVALLRDFWRHVGIPVKRESVPASSEDEETVRERKGPKGW